MAKTKIEKEAAVMAHEAAMHASASDIHFDRLTRQLWANLWDACTERTSETITLDRATLRIGLLKMRNG